MLVDSLMKKNIAKGKMTEQEREEVMKRVRTVTALSDFSNVDFVVEVPFRFLTLLDHSKTSFIAGSEREHSSQADHLPGPR